MKNFYCLLSIVLVTIIMSACGDDNGIDNTGTGESELFLLTFGSEAFMTDPDEAAVKSGTRISIDPNSENNNPFLWAGNEMIKAANILLPTTGLNTFSVTNYGDIKGSLPIEDMEKVEGSTSKFKMYAYTGDNITSDNDDNRLVSITYPSTRTYELKNSNDDENNKNYGKKLVFISEPIYRDVEWKDSRVVFDDPTLNFRPIFSTIRLNLYPPDSLRNAYKCDISSVSAKITLIGSKFETGMELDMDKSINSSSTADMIKSLKTSTTGTPSDNMAININYDYEKSLKIMLDKRNFFVIPIFASRAEGITGFTVTFTADCWAFISPEEFGDYTLTATRTVNIPSTTWDYGEKVNVNILAGCWTITKK